VKSLAIVSMDESGSLVVPEDVRREAGLRPGMPLRVWSNNGRVEIEAVPEVETDPESAAVKIFQKGKLWVVEPVGPRKSLTAETVRQTQNWIRDRGLED